MDPGLIERVRVRDLPSRRLRRRCAARRVGPCDGERGFTLIEMMIVVAVIAALAAVVVPTFFKESRKTKSSSEVSPMFAELSTREEQYKVDSGAYLAVAACSGTPSTTGVAATVCESATDWTALRINPTESTLKCAYVVTIGTGAGTNNPDSFTWTSPATAWYYIVATCDADGSSAVNATFFTSSSDTAIQKLNEGQ